MVCTTVTIQEDDVDDEPAVDRRMLAIGAAAVVGAALVLGGRD